MCVYVCADWLVLVCICVLYRCCKPVKLVWLYSISTPRWQYGSQRLRHNNNDNNNNVWTCSMLQSLYKNGFHCFILPFTPSVYWIYLQKRPVEDSDWRKNVEAMSGMEGRKKMFDAAKGPAQWTQKTGWCHVTVTTPPAFATPEFLYCAFIFGYAPTKMQSCPQTPEIFFPVCLLFTDIYMQCATTLLCNVHLFIVFPWLILHLKHRNLGLYFYKTVKASILCQWA